MHPFIPNQWIPLWAEPLPGFIALGDKTVHDDYTFKSKYPANGAQTKGRQSFPSFSICRYVTRRQWSGGKSGQATFGPQEEVAPVTDPPIENDQPLRSSFLASLSLLFLFFFVDLQLYSFVPSHRSHRFSGS